MAIDRADWHWETAEEEFRETNGITGELTQEQINQIWLYAANHIGQFVRWIIDRGFEGEDYRRLKAKIDDAYARFAAEGKDGEAK